MSEPRIRVALLYGRDDRILLIKQKKNDREYWLLPGGGVNYGEKLADALNRELQEELDVSLETLGSLVLVNDSVAPDGSRHLVNIAFEGTIQGTPRLTGEINITGLAYFTAEELEKLEIHPPINKALAGWLRGEQTESPYLGSIWTE